MSLPYGRDALRGRVAVVAGATRGAGRGIAVALGEAGATVVCTGRTSSLRKLKSDYDRPETIEETAELVTSLGGKGIATTMLYTHVLNRQRRQESGGRTLNRAAIWAYTEENLGRRVYTEPDIHCSASTRS